MRERAFKLRGLTFQRMDFSIPDGGKGGINEGKNHLNEGINLLNAGFDLLNLGIDHLNEEIETLRCANCSFYPKIFVIIFDFLDCGLKYCF